MFLPPSLLGVISEAIYVAFIESNRKGFVVVPKSNQDVTNVVSHFRNGRKYGGVQMHN